MRLGDAVTEVDVVDVEIGETRFELVARDDGTSSRQDALRLRVALGDRERRDHVSHDHVRSLEAERGRIADVELQDAMALGLEAGRMRVYRSADLVQHVLQLGRLLQRAITRLWVDLRSAHPSHRAR